VNFVSPSRIDGSQRTGLGNYLNHSRKKPNAKACSKIIDGTACLYFEAIRDIHPGEHIEYDYGERRKEVMKKFPWLRE